MNVIVFVNGMLLMAMGTLMGLNGIVFPQTGGAFLQAAALTLPSGACLCIVSSTRERELHRLHTFILTSSVWLTAALAGALPFWLWQLPPTDAFFEAMSGVTTTGSTVLIGLDTTERGILMWRALLQWIGGIGFIATGIALLPLLRVGGMQLFRTESSERGEKEMGSAARFASATIWLYVLLTALCIFTYIWGGMSGFDAIAHALATVATAGFSTHDASFGYFDSAFLQWAAIGFMIAGALPFAWYIRAINRQIIRSEQVRAFLLSLAAAVLILTAWLVLTTGSPVLEALRLVAFNVVSVMTTTGFATTDYMAWGAFAVVVFFVLTAIGGCTGSTSGGAKIMRWILFLRVTRAQIKTVYAPHGVFPIRYEGRPVDPGVLSGVTTFFIFYASSVFFLAVALGFFGLDFTTSVSGALTAVANVGPGVGPVIGPAGNFASLPDGAKWLISFGMYVGRLEMLTVFVLLTPAFWREMA